MRFRKKHYAVPEMQKSHYVLLNMDDFTGDWSSYFASASLPCAVELGAGKGKFLAHKAKDDPSHNYIGVDIETNAMVFAKRNLEETGVDNALLLCHDISNIEGVFPKDFADTLYIFFPNPWPKKRHNKRRLTHPRQLIQYHSFLKDGANIYFKTDDTELYEGSLSYLPAMGFNILKSSSNLKVEEDPTGIVTEYEQRWRDQGIAIKAIWAQKEKVAPEDLRKRLEQFHLDEKAKREAYRQAHQNT